MPMTKAVQTPTRIGTTNEHHAVLAATAKLAPIRQQFEEALSRQRQYHTVLSPVAEHAHVNVLARMDAALNRDKADFDVLRLEQALLLAQQDIDVARERARAEVAASFTPALRQAVQGLKGALLAARTANADVQRVQTAQHEATSQPYDVVSWMELGVRLDGWLATIKAMGLDD